METYSEERSTITIQFPEETDTDGMSASKQSLMELANTTVKDLKKSVTKKAAEKRGSAGREAIAKKPKN